MGVCVGSFLVFDHSLVFEECVVMVDGLATFKLLILYVRNGCLWTIGGEGIDRYLRIGCNKQLKCQSNG